MPNYCENDLQITGPQADIDRFMADGLSFESAIPYPVQFRALDEARHAHAIAVSKPGENPDHHFCKDCPKDGYNSGGYDWCIANWGTKWNISDAQTEMERISDDEVILHFSTAWSPPLPVIDAWGQKNPTLTFDLAYFECGMGFSGRYAVKGVDCLKNTENKKYRGTRGG